MEKEQVMPTTLEEAVDQVIHTMTPAQIAEIRKETEDKFMASVHHGYGTALRNAWGLWFQETEIAKWFQARNVVHADDRSGIILTCVYREIHQKEWAVQDQIDKYQAFWKKQGFADGIPK